MNRIFMEERGETTIHALRWKAAVPALLAALACSGCAHNAGLAKQGESRNAVLMFDSCAKPVYPREDLQANHQGMVTLRFLVSEEGNAVDSTLLQSSGYPSMDEAVRVPILKCRFKPALQNGRPVAQWTEIQYVWKIE